MSKITAYFGKPPQKGEQSKGRSRSGEPKGTHIEQPKKRAKRKIIEVEDEDEDVPWPEAEQQVHLQSPPKAKKPPTKKRREDVSSTRKRAPMKEEEEEDIPWEEPPTLVPAKKGGKGSPAKAKAKPKASKAAPTKPAASTAESPTKKRTKSPAADMPSPAAAETKRKRAHTVEKTVVEAKSLPAKRKGGGGGGYPFWGQNRTPPPLLGLKELPEGKPWCLWGKVFLVTGVLDSIERDDAFKLIECNGGKIAKSVTKKLTHAVVGTDAGAKKLEQIQSRKDVIALDEDSLFELIRNSPEQKPSLKEIEKFNKQRTTTSSPLQFKPLAAAAPLPLPSTTSSEDQQKLWVDKYKPPSVSHIVANPAAVRKLQDWLRNWGRVMVQRAKRGEAPARNAAQKKNAALLSGPPGIGKTTTAHLVAAACGYLPLEFNASDTRSKKMIKEHLAQSTDTKGLAEFFTSETTDAAKGETKKTVLIMDEVDGMSSGDRGGMAEIIALIKKTHVPIICLCNDRASPKVRSLANYCVDIQMQKPTTQQMHDSVMQILRSEQITIGNTTLTRIINASNGDMRHLLNMLQMLTVKSKDINALSPSELQERLDASLKEVDLGPFDAVTKLFSSAQYQKLSLESKLDLYFIDPSIVPLFIQENYLKCKPRRAHSAGHNSNSGLAVMELISKTADSFSDSDLFDVAIHRDQDWSLQPIHGVFSTVRPAEFMNGNFAGRIEFPKWLGRFSSRKKRYRLLTELAIRMSATASGDKALLRLDYLPYLVKPLVSPLLADGVDGVDQVLALMDAYGITRDDYDTILELMELSGKNWGKQIPTKVKSAFTRKYKAAHFAIKAAHLAIKAAPTRKGAISFILPEEAAQGHEEDSDVYSEEEEEEEEEETGESQKEEDSMIIEKKGGAAKRSKKPKETK